MISFHIFSTSSINSSLITNSNFSIFDKVAKIFARQNNIEVNVVNTFINVCINEEIVDGNIYKKYKILTSRGIQKRYFEIIKRRKDVTVFKEYFLLNGNNAYIIPNNVNIISLNDDINKQSKVKESKGKESKEDKEIEEVRKAISASLEEKAPANNIEYDQELHSWHGIDEDIIEDWEKRFPNISVGEQLMKIREHFKNNPDKEKEILKKFEGRMPIYINDWLERAEKYRIEIK